MKKSDYFDFESVFICKISELVLNGLKQGDVNDLDPVSCVQALFGALAYNLGILDKMGADFGVPFVDRVDFRKGRFSLGRESSKERNSENGFLFPQKQMGKEYFN